MEKCLAYNVWRLQQRNKVIEREKKREIGRKTRRKRRREARRERKNEECQA